MALLSNKEIYYRDWIERIEHYTGKKILSWSKAWDRFGVVVYFTDKTMVYLAEGAALPTNPEELNYERIPESICASCGQDRHWSTFNWKQQCLETVKAFWKKARKVYWHRYMSHN